nr:sulfur globule protein [Thioalkalivibrio sp.]
MRNVLKIIAAAFLIAMVAAPMQASAFWSGPGCMLANMFGMGGVSGGIGFSAGGGAYSSSHGPGYRYGYAYIYPYPYGYGPVYETPYTGYYAPPMLPYGPPPPAAPFR